MYTISDVTNFGKGQLGINLVVLSSCDNKLNAAGRAIYAGRLQKATIVTNVRVGCEYANFVNAKSDSKDFVSGGMKGFEWVVYPFVKRAIKSGKEYLSVNYRECDVRTKFESIYLLHGQVLSSDEVKAIKDTYFKKSGSSYSAKQAAAGVADEQEQTKVVTYALSDIFYMGTSLADARAEYNKVAK